MDWRKSTYSGPDDGNECVEIAPTPVHIHIRDSKATTPAILTFPAEAFAAFVDDLKSTGQAGRPTPV
ncbi:DUF397 domain-containing protein [Streptomyces sp. NPDC004542]|uniref:DUF397 domain-containing protein n=1 Tax=Streptomyces sp. NPDC004542 TaxID=3154281 RepID=UPI0033B915E6